MNEQQRVLLKDTIQKNGWCGDGVEIRLEVWSNFRDSADLLRNYLCRDGSGYIRGYYDGAGTFYIKRYHLRDEEWSEEVSTPA